MEEKKLTAVAIVGAFVVSAALSPLAGISIGTWAWLGLSAVLLVASLAAGLSGRRLLGYSLLGGFFIVGLGWWAPYWQGVWYAVLVQNPGGWQWLIVGILCLIGIGAVKPLTKEERYGNNTTAWGYLAMGLFALGVLGFLITGPLISGMYAQEHMAKNIVQPDAEQVNYLPESQANNSRIAPLTVSENWASNSLQYPRYHLQGGDITYINETPYWSWSLSPDGGYNYLTRQQIGAVYVNQASMEKEIIVHDDQEFKHGQGMGITDSYKWQVVSQDYLKDYGETFVVPHEGESYLVVPYKTHDWEFRATPIPQFYTVPKFSGVKVVDQDGNIEDVPASEVEEHPVLDGQNYYPYDLARFKVKSMAYKHGILNTFFGHEEQIELAPVPGDGNTQPFTIPTADGPTYLLAVEPWGDANGVYQVWVVDAQTGEMKYQQFSQEDALRGPRKAVDSIMGQPEISRLNDVQAVEPIPIIRGDTLYWQVRIIPDSAARVTYVAFFNADTEEVTVVETTEGVQAFLAQEQVETVAPDDQQNASDDADSEACDFRVVIQYEDGTTETTCVPDGASVTIGSTNSTTNGDSDE